ncbi:MAG: hypothetical protein LAT76_12435, partial [Schleiferiaceae bacterium]|nr:hypothetical protein [Schleiferiaceae bacterium]
FLKTKRVFHECNPTSAFSILLTSIFLLALGLVGGVNDCSKSFLGIGIIAENVSFYSLLLHSSITHYKL